jgi:hypothetical protein
MLRRFIMRLVAPHCERQRMELRHDIARTEAHAEDLRRTVRAVDERTVAEARDAYERLRKVSGGLR